MASFGKAYVPPNINQIPPNQRQTHPGLGDRDTAPNQRESNWNLVSAVRNPFGSSAESSTFGFWFNYFWNEAVEAPGLTVAQQVRVAEAFFSVFRQDAPPPSFKFSMRGDFASRENAYKENVLRQLLIIGFERVAMEAPEKFSPSDVAPAPGNFGRPKAPMPRVSVDAAQLNITPVEGNGKEWLVAYRCDSRSYDELCLHLGFNSRARTANAALRKSYALDEAWHPFANPVYTNSLFLRRGATNKDNCLHTVVSVGTHFSAATHFPILSDAANFETKSKDGQFLCAKPFDEWTSQDELLAANHRLKLRAHKQDGKIVYLERDNHVHVFYMNGLKGVNTQQVFAGRGGDSFPERGMENVPANHLLADILYRQRYWYNPNWAEIQLYELEFTPIRWVPDEKAIDTLLGSEAKDEIIRRVEEQVLAARNAQKVAAGREERTRYLANPEILFSPLQAQEVTGILKAAYTGNKLKRSDGPLIQKTYVKTQLIQHGKAALANKVDRVSAGSWSVISGNAKK